MRETKVYQLSEQEVKEAIRSWFAQQTNRSVPPGFITINVGKRSVGYGADEHDEYYCSGATIR